MPWQLTTSVGTGDLDANGPYTQVKIVRQLHDSVQRFIAVDLEYGNTVGGNWVPGIRLTSKVLSAIISGTPYDTLTTTSEPEVDEKTYDAVKRGLYEYLNDNGIIAAGAIV